MLVSRLDTFAGLVATSESLSISGAIVTTVVGVGAGVGRGDGAGVGGTEGADVGGTEGVGVGGCEGRGVGAKEVGAGVETRLKVNPPPHAQHISFELKSLSSALLLPQSTGLAS